MAQTSRDTKKFRSRHSTGRTLVGWPASPLNDILATGPHERAIENGRLFCGSGGQYPRRLTGNCGVATGPDFSKTELIPVIAQDVDTGDVLMLAYMNQTAYEETLKTGRVCYYSRSRQKLWRKGEESGNVQELRSLYFDCDADTLLVKVHQIGGAACHEGYKSCFFRQIDPATGTVTVVGDRVFDPKAVYGKA